LTCKKTGYTYSEGKALKLYGELLEQASRNVKALQLEAFEAAQLAKGMTKIDDQWYSREEVASMQAADRQEKQKLADFESDKIALKALAERRKRADGLLFGVEEFIERSPDQIVEKLEAFVDEYPGYEAIDDVRQALRYAELYSEAFSFEKNGASSKALSKYKMALAVKHSGILEKKVIAMDNKSLGL
jgi:hypothetical protein